RIACPVDEPSADIQQMLADADRKTREPSQCQQPLLKARGRRFQKLHQFPKVYERGVEFLPTNQADLDMLFNSSHDLVLTKTIDSALPLQRQTDRHRRKGRT